MRHKCFLFFLAVFPIHALAFDCSKVEPFKVINETKANVMVSRFFWTDNGQEVEDICAAQKFVHMYDIRNREEEAYYCLKPAISEMTVCQTKLDDRDAEVYVLPAIWVRNWGNDYIGDFHFHTYIVNKSDPNIFEDVFGRSLIKTLQPQHIFVEAAIKHGPSNPKDGYFVRMEFGVK